MPGSREDFLRNNAFSLYDLYAHAPPKEPLPRGHGIYNFGRPFLGQNFTYLVCLIYAWEYMLLQAGFTVKTWAQFDLRMKLDAWATINKQSSASTFTARTSDEIEKKWNSILSIIEVGNFHNLGAWHR